MHSGLLRHDGSPDRGARELQAFEHVGALVGTRRPAVALLHDYESLWLLDALPHPDGAGYWEQLLLFYRALRAMGQDVDVLGPGADLSGYRLVVAPALLIADVARLEALRIASEKASLVFGPRAGSRTPTGHVLESGQPRVLRQLAGVRLRSAEGLRPGLRVHVSGHEIIVWAESYEPVGGAAALAHYDDGPLAGEAAVVRRDNVTTIGAWSGSLVAEVLQTLAEELDMEPLRLPDGVRRNRHPAGDVWQNWTDRRVVAPGGIELPPVSTVTTGR
jgi:beta-galactosidase